MTDVRAHVTVLQLDRPSADYRGSWLATCRSCSWFYVARPGSPMFEQILAELVNGRPRDLRVEALNAGLGHAQRRHVVAANSTDRAPVCDPVPVRGRTATH